VTLSGISHEVATRHHAMTRHDHASTLADVFPRLGDRGTKQLFWLLMEQAFQDLIDGDVATGIGAEQRIRACARCFPWRHARITGTMSSRIRQHTDHHAPETVPRDRQTEAKKRHRRSGGAVRLRSRIAGDYSEGTAGSASPR